MKVIRDFIDVNIWRKLACVFLFFALLFIWIAFTCTGWGEEGKASSTGYHVGLWRQCSTNASIGCKGLDGHAADWFGFTQASAVFGFIGINVSTILVGLAIFSARCKGNQDTFLFTVSILCLSIGLFFFIGIMVFRAKFNTEFVGYSFSYAFGLATAGCLAQICVGIFLLLDKLISRQRPNQNSTE